MKHDLYETSDQDAPSEIKDSNDEVVLGLCKVCDGAEASLPTMCPGRRLSYGEQEKIHAATLDFRIYRGKVRAVEQRWI